MKLIRKLIRLKLKFSQLQRHKETYAKDIRLGFVCNLRSTDNQLSLAIKAHPPSSSFPLAVDWLLTMTSQDPQSF